MIDVGGDLLLTGSTAACWSRVAGQGPDTPAVRASDGNWTRGELDEAARIIAGALQQSGRDPDLPVALLLEPGARLVAAMLGVLAAGRFFVALDPDSPGGRNDVIAEDSGAALVVTTAAARAQAEALGFGGAEILDVEALLAGAVHGVTLPQPEGGLDRPVALTYTSGSTGRPKGVVQTNASLLHNVGVTRWALGIEPQDRCTLLYPASVNPALRDIFTALLSGAVLCIYPVAARGLAGLAAWIREEKLTVFCSGVTVFHRFDAGLAEGEGFPDVKAVKLGGEPVGRREVEAFRRRFSPPARLYSGLGTTETGTVTVSFADHRGDLPSGIVLGHPAPDTVIRLAGDHDGRLSPGASGEVVVESRFLSSGYWRQPELTRAAFEPGEDGTRRYRTGDVARVRSDGSLEHLGRADAQIKLDGIRIEVAEVEAALAGAGGVEDVAVALDPGTGGSSGLTAYLVGKPGVLLDWEAIRNELYRSLPRAMVPRRAVLVRELPLTPNGKLDRASLPGLAGRELSSGRKLTYPRDPIETRLAALWCEVLSHGMIGIEENFFDLGGDSLRAVELFAEIEARFGISLPLATIFESATVASQAALLRDGLVERGTASVVTLAADGSGAPVFCVPAVDGYAFVYRPLAELLGEHHAVHVLQFPGLDGITPPLSTVEEMAGELIRRMRLVQPSGPYQLLGHSFGGMVAYEMTRQLQAAAERVGLLVLVDSHVPRSIPLFARALRDVEKGVLGLRTIWRECAADLGWLGRALASIRVLAHMAVRGYTRRLRNTMVEHTIHEVRRVATAARLRYRFGQPLEVRGGRVLLLRAAPQKGAPRLWCRFIDARNGWGPRMATRIEAHDIPGDHIQMLAKPGVEAVAALLRDCLAE